MPDPSELIFPDDAPYLPPGPPPPPPRPMPRPPMRPPTPPLCSIRGTVKNRFGFPLSGVRVSLNLSQPGNSLPIMETVSNRFGVFSFSRVRPGNYTLTARNRYRNARQRIPVNGRNCNVRNINLVL